MTLLCASPRCRDPKQRDKPRTIQHGVLCRPCIDRLETTLAEIGDLYALLPFVVEPGTVEADPDGIHAKRAEAPAPLRLDVAAATDKRGDRSIPAVLVSWCLLVAEERRIATPGDNVVSMVAFLSRHLDWIVAQDWSPELVTETHRLLYGGQGPSGHVEGLRDLVGEHKTRPVGRCPVVAEGETQACGGPLLPSRYGAEVWCPWCGATWGPEALRRLGLILSEEAS